MLGPYAHTAPDSDDASSWEPLYAPFGEGVDECQREHSVSCESLDPRHDHLNKVAWWTAKFAANMFSLGPVWRWTFLKRGFRKWFSCFIFCYVSV